MLNKLQLQHLELQLQNLDQPLCLKSEQKFNFMNKRQLPNQQIIANMVLSINISNSNNLDKFWVDIFTGQGQVFTDASWTDFKRKGYLAP